MAWLLVKHLINAGGEWGAGEVGEGASLGKTERKKREELLYDPLSRPTTLHKGEEREKTLLRFFFLFFRFFFCLAEGRKILPGRKSVLPARVCPAEWLLAGVRANTGRHTSAGFSASRGTFTADETAKLLPMSASYLLEKQKQQAGSKAATRAKWRHHLSPSDGGGGGRGGVLRVPTQFKL